MARDDESPPPLVGRAGLVFAYVCCLLSLGAMGAAIVVLPLAWKVKLFLAGAVGFLAVTFVLLAIAAFLVRPGRGASPPRPPR